MRKPLSTKKKDTADNPLKRTGNAGSWGRPEIPILLWICIRTTNKAAKNLNAFRPGNQTGKVFFEILVEISSDTFTRSGVS